ncbi:hypothetical protein V8D89_007906, partial [Ganoderma adspersum]
RYVTKAKKGKGKPRKAISSPKESSGDGVGPIPSLRTANGVISGTGTPLPQTPANGNTNLAAIAAQILDRPEPDGATIHCLAISECPGRRCAACAVVSREPSATLGDGAFGARGVAEAPARLLHWGLARRARGQAVVGGCARRGDRGAQRAACDDIHRTTWLALDTDTIEVAYSLMYASQALRPIICTIYAVLYRHLCREVHDVRCPRSYTLV